MRFCCIGSAETLSRRISRIELSITISELADMPMPAIHGVTTPMAASGTAVRIRKS